MVPVISLIECRIYGLRVCGCSGLRGLRPQSPNWRKILAVLSCGAFLALKVDPGSDPGTQAYHDAPALYNHSHVRLWELTWLEILCFQDLKLNPKP